MDFDNEDEDHAFDFDDLHRDCGFYHTCLADEEEDEEDDLDFDEDLDEHCEFICKWLADYEEDNDFDSVCDAVLVDWDDEVAEYPFSLRDKQELE